MMYGSPDGITCALNNVAITAIAMPIMPYTLPRRDVSWFERPPRHRMNRIAAPRYATIERPEVMFARPLLFAEHGQHAPRHCEAAEHVDRRKRDRHDGQPAYPLVRTREVR